MFRGRNTTLVAYSTGTNNIIGTKSYIWNTDFVSSSGTVYLILVIVSLLG